MQWGKFQIHHASAILMTDPIPPQQRPLTGIAARLAAVAALSIMFALVKLAFTRGVNIFESLFYRQFLAIPLILVWIAMGPGWSALKTKRPGAHMVRMGLGLTGMGFNFGAMILLPLAEATVIGFTVPMFATILAALLLGEKVGLPRWSAVLLGFAGVLIVVQPGHANIAPMGAAVALTGALMTAAVTIQIRQLGATENPATTVIWFTVSSLIPLGILMFWFAQPHDGTTWAILFGIGLTGGIGQLCLTAALRFAPVSVVMPMDYTALIWSTLWGLVIFETLPSPWTWVGAPIIIGSGLIIVWRENMKQKRIATTGESDTTPL